jgi:hypothetical protein
MQRLQQIVYFPEFFFLVCALHAYLKLLCVEFRFRFYFALSSSLLFFPFIFFLGLWHVTGGFLVTWVW